MHSMHLRAFLLESSESTRYRYIYDIRARSSQKLEAKNSIKKLHSLHPAEVYCK
uniref:Uncharacterized protein n=1 Tax=Anopheles albimanus TaxID=7167 RepID=A0A182FZE3_ANOAL